MFFEIKVYNICKVKADVISIGNISVGGSGKTPLVICITNMLKQMDRKPSVLSRGYGRKSKGFVLVSDGNEILTTVEKCGDEIYHTVKECKVPAAVCENRCEGAARLITDFDTDVVVLDDAFQHRWIYRDIDLVIFDQQFLLDSSNFNHYLLPSGYLREPFTALKRADIIIINRKFNNSEPVPQNLKPYFDNKKVYTAYYQEVDLVDIRKETHYKVEEFRGQKSLVISGIANPYSFVKALEKNNINTDNKIIFRDHKDYTIEEIKKIRKLFYSSNSYSVITTEKDAVKLSTFSNELDDIDIYYLKIEIKIDKEEEFINYLKLNLSKKPKKNLEDI